MQTSPNQYLGIRFAPGEIIKNIPQYFSVSPTEDQDLSEGDQSPAVAFHNLTLVPRANRTTGRLSPAVSIGMSVLYSPSDPSKPAQRRSLRLRFEAQVTCVG